METLSNVTAVVSIKSQWRLSGEVDLTTRLSFNKGGSMTVEKALDYFKKAKTYDEKNIVEQLDDLSNVSKD